MLVDCVLCIYQRMDNGYKQTSIGLDVSQALSEMCWSRCFDRVKSSSMPWGFASLSPSREACRATQRGPWREGHGESPTWCLGAKGDWRTQHSETEKAQVCLKKHVKP